MTADSNTGSTGTIIAGSQDSEQDVADRMFGSTASLLTSYGAAIQDSTNGLTDSYGWTPEQRDAHMADMVHAFHDAHVRPDHASRLHSLLAHHARNRPDDTTVSKWSVETRKQLRERYGLEEGDRRLATAKAFIANRPALRQMLNDSGVGSHPDFVTALVEHSHLMRVKPRSATNSRPAQRR